MSYFLLLLLTLYLVSEPADSEHTNIVPTISINEIDALRDSGIDTLYIVNFWATWCKPCIKELPYFEKVRADHANKPVKVMLVSLDLPRTKDERVGNFVRENDIRSDVYVMEETNANYFIPIISDSWQGNIPATLLLQPKLRKEQFYAKEFTQEELNSIIEPLIP